MVSMEGKIYASIVKFNDGYYPASHVQGAKTLILSPAVSTKSIIGHLNMIKKQCFLHFKTLKVHTTIECIRPWGGRSAKLPTQATFLVYERLNNLSGQIMCWVVHPHKEGRVA